MSTDLVTGMKIQTVLQIMQRRCDELGSQAEFAREAGVPRQHVSLVLKGERPPTDGMLAALGLERCEATYRRVKR